MVGSSSRTREGTAGGGGDAAPASLGEKSRTGYEMKMTSEPSMVGRTSERTFRPRMQQPSTRTVPRHRDMTFAVLGLLLCALVGAHHLHVLFLCSWTSPPVSQHALLAQASLSRMHPSTRTLPRHRSATLTALGLVLLCALVGPQHSPSFRAHFLVPKTRRATSRLLSPQHDLLTPRLGCILLDPASAHHRAWCCCVIWWVPIMHVSEISPLFLGQHVAPVSAA